MPLETMLRVYFLQNWYGLSDSMAEGTLYDSEAMLRFARIDLGDGQIPDETTIQNFRHLLDPPNPQSWHDTPLPRLTWFPQRLPEAG